MKRVMLFAGLLLLLSGGAHAQWKSRASLGSSFYKGNVDKFNLHASGSLAHADSMFEYSSSAEATYSEVERTTDNQVLTASLKFDYLPYGAFSPFMAVTAYNNRPKKIELRLSGLIGGKYTFVNIVNEEGKQVADYSFSAAVQVDREQYLSDAENTEKIRLSVRPKFEHNISEYVSFRHVTYYVPKIAAFKDFIIDSDTSLKTKITDKFSFEVTYKLDHQSRLPDENLKNTDHALITSLVFSL